MPKQNLKKSSLPKIWRKNALKNPFLVLFGGCRWPMGRHDGRGWKNVVENFVQIREVESLDILETVDLDIFQDGQDCFLTSRHSEHPCRWGGLQGCSWWCAGVFKFSIKPSFPSGILVSALFSWKPVLQKRENWFFVWKPAFLTCHGTCEDKNF